MYKRQQEEQRGYVIEMIRTKQLLQTCKKQF